MSPLAYTPPGVTVEQLSSPSLTPLLALPGSVCLVGTASGSISRTDIIQLYGNTPTKLPGVPVGANVTASSITSVIDVANSAANASGYQNTTDYVFSTSTVNGVTSYSLARTVTPTTVPTLTASATAGATSITITGSQAPTAGTTIRITSGATTEAIVVSSVSSQTLTLAAPGLVNSYPATATVVWGGSIPEGDSLYVTYNYVPNDYYYPIRLTSQADVQQRFGQATDALGATILSPLSFAASLAFQNGASSIVLQPLYKINSSTGLRVAPAATDVYAPATWSTTFTGLLEIEDVNILVPVIGQSSSGNNLTDGVMASIEAAAQDYLYQTKHQNSIYAVAILGEDSTGNNTFGTEAIINAHAQTLSNRYGGDVAEQTVLINTSAFTTSTNSGSALAIGGQYVAAAVAGMLSSRNPATTLTRQAIAGITSVTDYRSAPAKNSDASNGLMVVEGRGNVVRIRHAITLSTANVAARELNVVRAKHYIVESVRQTLDSQVVGVIVADADAPTLVNNVVIAVLENLRRSKILVRYSGVQSRITALDPTSMQVQFTYQPAFVVNYIDVQFSLDLSGGALTIDTNVLT